ncbi:ABC transporter ATP-binding protein [Nakamurella aerolata]|uniref:ABC transporter ATP-binding protein n=1 Tax=Nakamurella aerolata TaxID=1656892 RepID=A0A849A6B9_9ACTN|nr:ABC transporter ATP-binding protein [Nakamurella aerolata]NNG34571.1 ABC transporter ATP-binding protein [Nakamurella aerolata]
MSGPDFGAPAPGSQPPSATSAPQGAEPSAGSLPAYPAAAPSDPRTAQQALALRDLTKTFGDKVAVDHVNLDVPAGSFFGLVGPNGAGKTTTLSMVSGLLVPTAGRIFVDGVDVWADPAAAKARMGVLPEGLRLFERLSGAELLSYLGRLRGLPADVVNQRATSLLDVLDLSDAGDKLVADYSTGMRKKITLAAALLHSPPLLLLDEPLEAVDPVSARTIRTVLTQYRQAGGTVIFSSHVMALVEELCTHVAVMAAGRIVAAGELATVRGSAASLDDAFFHLVGGQERHTEGLSWLQSR